MIPSRHADNDGFILKETQCARADEGILHFTVGIGNLSEAIPIWDTNYVIESTPQAPPIHGRPTYVCLLLGVL